VEGDLFSFAREGLPVLNQTHVLLQTLNGAVLQAFLYTIAPGRSRDKKAACGKTSYLYATAKNQYSKSFPEILPIRKQYYICNLLTKYIP